MLSRSSPDLIDERGIGQDDDELIEALPETLFDGIISLAALALKAPMAYFAVIDGNRVVYKGRYGWTADVLPIEDSISAAMANLDEPLFIPDVIADGRFSDRGEVTGEAGIRFYAGVPIRASTGKSVGALCVVDTKPRSVTPEEVRMLDVFGRDLEMRLARAIADLRHQRLHDERVILTDMVLHDAHGILGALKWSLDSLERSLDPAPKALVHSQQSVDTLMRLCGSISERDGLTRTEISVNAAPQHLRYWFDLLTQRASRIIGRAGLEMKAVNDLPVGLIALDVHLVERVLMNLVRNACVACSDGGTRIEIEARSSGDLVLEFRVADDGPGVADEIRDRIFDPYFSMREEGSGGSGLGLAFAKLAARALHGSIDYSPRQPRGAVFRLAVPIGATIRTDA